MLGTNSPELEHKDLRSQLINKLQAAGRAGEAVESARIAGQIDILLVIFKIPQDVLNKEMGKSQGLS